MSFCPTCSRPYYWQSAELNGPYCKCALISITASDTTMTSLTTPLHETNITMTPSDIAREAAEAIFMPRSRSVHPDPDIDHERRIDECAALILTAAAKMVRESGAEKALSRMVGNCTRYLEERPVPMSEMYQDNPPPTVLEEANAALQSLRSLTEHKGEA